MLQATITVPFGINCTARSSDYNTHYNACYVIMDIIVWHMLLYMAEVGLDLVVLCDEISQFIHQIPAY